jgi:hypothetical protein
LWAVVSDTEGQEAERLAREVVTACWTNARERTDDARSVYVGASKRAIADAHTAVLVIDRLASLAVTSAAFMAAVEGVADDEAIAHLFRTLDEPTWSLPDDEGGNE